MPANGGSKAKACRGRGCRHCYTSRAWDVMGTRYLNSLLCAWGDLGPFDHGLVAGGFHQFGLDPAAMWPCLVLGWVCWVFSCCTRAP